MTLPIEFTTTRGGAANGRSSNEASFGLAQVAFNAAGGGVMRRPLSLRTVTKGERACLV